MMTIRRRRSSEMTLPRRPSLPTVSSCLRRFCLACLGATSGPGAFDCMATDCPLYPYRHWHGPGKEPKRKLSEKRLTQLAEARQGSPLIHRSQSHEQKASTAVGGAFDA
jgi:hypothetical protein